MSTSFTSSAISAFHDIATDRAENIRKVVAQRDQLLSAANSSVREKDGYIEDIKSRWVRGSL